MSDADFVSSIVTFVRDEYRTNDPVPLHSPTFRGNEQRYVADTVASTFVSSVGAFVDRFEQETAAFTGVERAVATVNGTAALHVALRLLGVGPGDLVVTQPLTFVATCNAIAYCGAEPLFIDVDRATLGLSPTALRAWLDEHAEIDNDGVCRDRSERRTIRACVPMHTFGHPVDIDGLVAVCADWNIPMLEDAAEALGSYYKGRHTGGFGALGTLSYNGNKIITTGGGGMVLACAELGARAKHLTTTAKRPHTFEYVHDEVGYNYRMPNINAALGCAQLEQIEKFLAAKRALAGRYAAMLDGGELWFVTEPADCRSNYWLNAVICQDVEQRDLLLEQTNRAGVMTRPVWALMNHLRMYGHCRRGLLDNAEWLAARVVNLPSSVTPVTA